LYNPPVPGAERLLFDRFALEPAARRLFLDGEPVALSTRSFDLLHLLASRAGQILTKDQLIEAAWRDVAVTDNSLEQAISQLRRVLAGGGSGSVISTEARRGYRFVGSVRRETVRVTDAGLDGLLAPHRAWLEGRAALETLERGGIARARDVFAAVLRDAPHQASAHVGLANACVMLFETTRTADAPDRAALEAALEHAREACRLDKDYGEAWATLGFVLDRSGRPDDALAAARRSVALEPDNWRHRFRLAYISWGEERLREAQRTLTLLPEFPLARYLAATVHVARQAFGEAERELDAGLAGLDQQRRRPVRFSAVALYWLRGLLALARGEEEQAEDLLRRELASESSGHLYARECCANTWYAIGVLAMRRRNRREATHAFAEALERMPGHALARLANTLCEMPPGAPASRLPALLTAGDAAGTDPIGRAMLVAAGHVAIDQHVEAARVVQSALSDAAEGSGGWLLPIEPLLDIRAHQTEWAPALQRLRLRAA
jgi:DNA-binding winged helix-turn-helix (wHTH) protein/Tfp pilus assembly protein PilF